MPSSLIALFTPLTHHFWKALYQSNEVRDTKPHLSYIFSATRGIIFLGTPHRGSGMTILAKLVAAVAEVGMQDVNHGLLRDLERDSHTLDRIRDSFSRILDQRVLKVWSFEEELAVTGGEKVYISCLWYMRSSLTVISQVVYGDSAIIGDAHEIRGSIHADHLGMVKFATRSDSEYQKVLHGIEMLLEQLDDDQLGSYNPSV